MMMLNLKILTLIVFESASVARSYEENPSQLIHTLHLLFFRGQEFTFDYATHVNNIYFLNQCPLLSEIGFVFCYLSET